MLIEFSVANFLSIKDRQTLRMDAASISEYPERIIDAGRHKLLRSAAIYGANASGKSNVLKAIQTMREIVTKSAERSSVAEIDVEPFLLSTETEYSPSYFEIIFLINEIQYRYGFEADRNVVHAEWLFEAKKNVEKSMFLRENDVIEISKEFKEGKGLEEKTRNNALFLAVCDQFNGKRAKAIIGWLGHLIVVSGINHMNHNVILGQVFRIDILRNYFLRILKQVNLGFSTIEVQEAENNESFVKYLKTQDKEDITDLFDGHFLKSVKSSHTKYDLNKEAVGEILFDTDKQESEGTKKFLDITSFISLSIGVGGCMIIDELDAKLHPLLTQAVIRLFNNPETNPNNAQLIFATHDTNLLTYGQFRRDQIWFTEKDKYGATCLYSLVEYQEEDGIKVRKDRSFETDYINGRYGAIPFIGDFSKLFRHDSQREN